MGTSVGQSTYALSMTGPNQRGGPGWEHQWANLHMLYLWQDLISVVDQDGNGQITFNEFVYPPPCSIQD